jgi:hypothetical protein
MCDVFSDNIDGCSQVFALVVAVLFLKQLMEHAEGLHNSGCEQTGRILPESSPASLICAEAAAVIGFKSVLL